MPKFYNRNKNQTLCANVVPLLNSNPMKKLYLFLSFFLTCTVTQAQLFPPGFCYNNDFQLELTVTGNQVTCNDSFLLSTSSIGFPQVFWSDGFFGDSRWITTPGVYQAYAYDINGCIDTTDAIQVDVNTNAVFAFSATFNYTFCEGDSLLLTSFSSGVPTWSDGQVGTDIYVTTPGFYSFTAIDPNGCLTTSNTIEAIQLQRPQISISQSGNATICLGDSIVISASGANNINWINGWSFNNNLTITQSGQYAAVALDSTGSCPGFSDTLTVIVREPYAETLCFVTVDSTTGKNQLLWNNTPDQGTSTYNVYTESNIFGQYTLLGSVPFGTTSFIDVNSVPEQQPYRYYIAAVDTCGNENSSAMFGIHGTIHLTSSLGVNGQNNLNWSQYIGIFPVLSYEIYRSNNFGPFVQISTISASFNSFSDLNPPAGNNRYFVGIQAPAGCGNGTTVARSNMVSNQATGIAENEIRTWNVLSNPSKGLFEFNGLSDLTGEIITIYSVLGEIVHRSTIQNDWARIDLTNHAAGVYLANINGNTIRLIKE